MEKCSRNTIIIILLQNIALSLSVYLQNTLTSETLIYHLKSSDLPVAEETTTWSQMGLMCLFCLDILFVTLFEFAFLFFSLSLLLLYVSRTLKVFRLVGPLMYFSGVA